jgi:putative transposase
MPGPKPIALEVTPEQRQALQTLVNQPTAQQRLVTRAGIILMAALGSGTRQTARALRISEDTVCFWRHRWNDAGDHPLEALDLSKRLADAPRSGGPPTFTSEQWCQIMAIVCEDPVQCGRPISHWTLREVAEEASKRQIVDTISPGSVGRFFKRSRSQTASQPLLADAPGEPAA